MVFKPGVVFSPETVEKQRATNIRKIVESHLAIEVAGAGKIHWAEAGYKLMPNGQHRLVVPIECSRCGKRKTVPVFRASANTRNANFTGMCRGCTHKHFTRENAANWKGGRYTTDKGYVMVRPHPDDPYFCMANKTGSVLEHRLVMARRLGRPLLPTEHVHHIDRVRNHNHPDNLEILNGKTHYLITKLENRVIQLEEFIKSRGLPLPARFQ